MKLLYEKAACKKLVNLTLAGVKDLFPNSKHVFIYKVSDVKVGELRNKEKVTIKILFEKALVEM